MRLYGRHASPYVRRVAVTLRLYGLDYEHVALMPFGGDRRAVGEINPLARVPALRLDDGEVLVDSAAILDWLDEVAGPDRALTPAGGAARRRVLLLLAIAQGAMEKLVAGLYERQFRPRELWFKPWLDACDTQVADGFRWLDAQVGETWLAGPAMTQADVTASVFWLFGEARRPNFFGRLDCPRLRRLARRLADSPAFVATAPEPAPLSKELA